MVRLSRYRDNIYIALAHVPDPIVQLLKSALCVLLKSTYGVPLKWEPHGERVAWGERLLTPMLLENRVSLICKGVCFRIFRPNPRGGCGEAPLGVNPIPASHG